MYKLLLVAAGAASFAIAAPAAADPGKNKVHGKQAKHGQTTHQGHAKHASHVYQGRTNASF